MQSYIKHKRYYNKKAKVSQVSRLKEKYHCIILHPKAVHQGSKLPGLVEKVLPNNIYLVRKLNSNKTKILHRIASENTILKNLLKPTIRRLDGRLTTIMLFHKTIYTPLHGKWISEDTYLNILIICVDPIASDFDESHTQGPDTVIVARSYVHDSSDGQNRETCPTSDPSIVLPSNPISQGQSQVVETTTDLRHNDSSTRGSQSNADIESTY